MTLKEDIVKALEALNPRTEPTRAKLENDPSAIAVSVLLKSSAGLCLLEYIILENENFVLGPVLQWYVHFLGACLSIQ